MVLNGGRHLFGTDGVRGVANVEPMTSETALRLGRALAHVSKRSQHRHKILIGKDTRLSGYMLEQAMASIPTLGEMYLGMLQHGASAFAEVARLVAASSDDAPTAVLVHCTAGKDRTGVATALLLDAVGAERAAVVADYASSEQNLAGPWADTILQALTSAGLPVTPALRTLATGTPPEAIETAFAWLDSTYDGAAGYLLSGGLTDAELAALRTRLAG